jgi:hypothetical protein
MTKSALSFFTREKTIILSMVNKRFW